MHIAGLKEDLLQATLTFSDGRFLMHASEDHWPDLRKVGFVFDRIRRCYQTSDWELALRHIDFADPVAEAKLTSFVEEREAAMRDSYAMTLDEDVAIPVPYIANHKGEPCDYLPYQKAGILYAAERNDTLIADPPGLGKTITAIGLINLHDLENGVIICPATLKLNWLKEMTKWMVNKDRTIGIAYGNEIPATDFVIINYDILNRNRKELWSRYWDILVADECQYLKNPDSARTKAVLGTYYFDYQTQVWKRKRERIKCLTTGKMERVPCLRADYRLFLTGTPMMKKPKDMWTIIRECDPKGIGSDFVEFAYRYCDGVEGPFGLEADGGSNLSEFNELIRRKFMIRRLKKYVLKDLPPKTREVVVFPPEGMKRIIKTERDKFSKALAAMEAHNDEEFDPKTALEDMDPAFILDTMTRYLPQGFDAPEIEDLSPGEVEPGFAAYSQARHELALSKVPLAVEHIQRLLDADEKVIVFAIHKDVIEELHAAFPQAARIVGGMGAKKVEADKLRFQGDAQRGIDPDPDCNIILCNLKAGGVGHTLTEATFVVFVEMWSVPGDTGQAEDRAHRIGLQHNVHCQYLVVDGTIDALTIQTLIDAIAMIEEGVDGVEV